MRKLGLQLSLTQLQVIKSTQSEIYVRNVPVPFTTKRITEEHQLTRFNKSLFHSFLPTAAWIIPRKMEEELEQEQKKEKKRRKKKGERRREVMVSRQKASQLIIGKIMSHCMSTLHTILCFVSNEWEENLNDFQGQTLER